MALIGEIAVNIVARTGQFTKGIKLVQKQLTTVGKNMAAFGAATAGGLLAAAKSFANFGDETAKMAKRVGVSVESLSALEFAAAQSGSSLATVEKGIRGMARSLLDAERGSAEIVFAFDQLGLSVSQLQQLTPEQQFLSVARALSAIEDPTRKAGLAMKLLGRSGTELLPLFNEGATGIAALIKEAEDLGIVLSAKDAAAAEQLNDAFGRLGFQFKAIVKEFAVAISGPLLQFLDRAKEIGKATIDWIGRNQGLVVTIAKVGFVIGTVGALLLAFSKFLGIVTVAIKGLATAILFLTAHPLVALATALAAIVVVGLNAAGAFDKLTEWLGGVGTGANDAAAGIRNMRAEVEQLSEGMQRVQQFAKGHPLLTRGELTQDSQLFNQLRRRQRNLDELEALVNPTARQRESIEFERRRIAQLEKRLGQRAGQAEIEAFTPEQHAARFMTKALMDGIISAATAAQQAIRRGTETVTGGRLGLGGTILEKIGGVFNALGKMPTEIQELVRGQNNIIQKGSQEAIAFARQHERRGAESDPGKQTAKNTKETVKAVNGVKKAINDLSAVFGREPVFSIPAS